ncbi:MAG: acyl-CoA reductase [Flavobacteriales bacterium]|nr:acyl-CoA reductase [Flavobacteriales bacterium]MBT3964539.1 acyl-CoA reductase [Flavobacteriales bacterium]MBT4705390.1 acyl-CoA reductase [Flavobacteriales bacterium]MBT4929859.1 acyl-CoA reductase [Flavobacteriales bacterium]MBT5132233.1 acyl-CoA reductase [Flavobacteriales bacterium]
MTLQEKIAAFDHLGQWLRRHEFQPDSTEYASLNEVIRQAFHQNGWFTEDEVIHALRYWAKVLTEQEISKWTGEYGINKTTPQRVGLILAGNIPLVGLHDIFCVLLSGHRAIIKHSSSDPVLTGELLRQLMIIEPRFSDFIKVVDGQMKDIDAIIATGSNNSARHFEDYFGHLPKIIRKNRTSVALLKGSENQDELHGLCEDAFRYFGLGCRNVTKIFVPRGYDLNAIFQASLPFEYLMANKKFANNYTYYKTLLMMEQRNILENGLVLLVEDDRLYSPVSVLNYEFYDSMNDAEKRIEEQRDSIQCVVGSIDVPFGSAQNPSLNTFADGVDTLSFLVSLGGK